MTYRFSLLMAAAAALTLGGCEGSVWNGQYIPPTGFAYHSSTPISAPHGYKKTIREETDVRRREAAATEGWRNASVLALLPFYKMLTPGQPVAVVPHNRRSAEESTAADFLREELRANDYLITIEAGAPQKIFVRTDKTDDPNMRTLTIWAERDDKEVARHSVPAKISYDQVEDQ